MPRIPNIPKRKLPQAKATQHSLKLTQLLQQGMKLHLGGQLEEAKNIYEQINKIDPNHFDALQLLGAVAVKTKNYGKAIDLLTKAISINPNVWMNHLYIMIKQLKLIQISQTPISIGASFSKSLIS